MQEVTITEPAADLRPVLPSTLAAAFGLSVAAAGTLADEVGDRLATDPTLCGRPLWRETVQVRSPATGGHRMPVPRWPIETDPPVVIIIDGTTLDADGIEVSGERRNLLYRRFGWDRAVSFGSALTGAPSGPATLLYYDVGPMVAGYLMPGQIVTYAADLVVQNGGSLSYQESPGWVRATNRRVRLRFEVTSPGVTSMDPTEPEWPTEVGETVESGAVTLTARAAFELPSVEKSLEALASTMLASSQMSTSISEEEIKDHRIKYRDASSVGKLAETLKALR